MVVKVIASGCMRFALLLPVLIILVVVSGCTQQQQSGSNKGLTITTKASPPEIFAGSGETDLQVGIENLGQQTFHNVRVMLYDIGDMYYPHNNILDTPKMYMPSRGDSDYCSAKIANGYGPCTLGEGDCDDILNSGQSECASPYTCRTLGSSIWSKLTNWLSQPDICCDPVMSDDDCLAYYENWAQGSDDYVSMSSYAGFAACSHGNPTLRPGGFDSYSCKIQAPPSIVDKSETNILRTRATFETKFSTSAIASIVSESEYQRMKATNSLSSSPRSFSSDDGNIRVDVEFSEDMPIVDRPNKDAYMYVTITNIGNGYLDQIRPQDIVIYDTSSDSPYGAIQSTQSSNGGGLLDQILGIHTGNVLGLEDISMTTGLQHGESGCLFDFQCADGLLCRSATYLTPIDNLCCSINEDAVLVNGQAKCKPLSEINPYTVSLATEIIGPGDCDIDHRLSPLTPIGDGKHFPKITCHVALPSDVQSIVNHFMVVTVGYKYELRQDTPVRVLQ